MRVERLTAKVEAPLTKALAGYVPEGQQHPLSLVGLITLLVRGTRNLNMQEVDADVGGGRPFVARDVLQFPHLRSKGEDSGFRVRGVQAQGSGFRVSGFGFRVQSFGFRVSDFGIRVQGFGFLGACIGFRVSGFKFWVSGFGFRDSGFGFRVLAFEFRISGFGFRV